MGPPSVCSVSTRAVSAREGLTPGDRVRARHEAGAGPSSPVGPAGAEMTRKDRLRLTSLQALRPPMAVWIAAVAAWGGAAISLAAVLVSTVQVYASADEDLGINPYLTALGVATIFALTPAAAGAFAVCGRGASRGVMVLVGLAATLTSYEYPIAWAATILFLSAAVALFSPGSSDFFSLSRSRRQADGMPGRRRIKLQEAYIWLAFFGLAGGHLFYVRRAWQGLLYAALLALAIVSIPSPVGILLAIALVSLAIVDISRLPAWVVDAGE